MKTTNIISAYQSILAIESNNIDTNKIHNMLELSNHEAKTLAQFCNILIQQKLTFDVFDGYYVGYSIKQISKEFDLLRFSDDLVINIELKSELELSILDKMDKIRIQMERNYYYLTSISRVVLVYTFVENDGLYQYDSATKQPIKVKFSELITNLSSQAVNYNIDPDKLFVPSNFLISPFNNTKRFIEDDYFLSDAQQKIKKEVLKSVSNNSREFFCISANAGTGKTLLMYDIVKTLRTENQRPIVIHCGKLNSGHGILKSDFEWNIVSIGNIKNATITSIISDDTSIIFIDESHRIRSHQLEYIIERATALNISVVFAYDKKQYLIDGETKDIFEYLQQNHSEIITVKKTLTNKIRTNKEMASFITNLFDIGKSNSNLNYENVTIEYFSDFENARRYMTYLSEYRGWKAITYTNSSYNVEPISQIANICDWKAHDVIGQEFDKVVFVMDQNFRYKNGKLQSRQTYYSIKGMLYQIVTRVVNELKIIVLNNPALYSKLLEVKALDKQNNN